MANDVLDLLSRLPGLKKIELAQDLPEQDPLVAQPHEGGYIFVPGYPRTIAGVLAQELYSTDGRIAYCRGNWYKLGEFNVWAKVPEDQLEKAVFDWMARQWFVAPRGGTKRMPTTMHQRTEVISALRVMSAMVPPNYDHAPTVNLRDAKIVVGRNLYTEPYTPEDFVTTTLPMSSADWAGAEPPLTWLKFLPEGFTENDITNLQEFAGYILTMSTAYDKMLWIQGIGGTGKSTINNVLMWLVGETNMAAMNAAKLKSQFNAKLEGKRLFNFADYRAGPWDDHMLTFCLRVAGREVTEIEPKGVDAYDTKLDGKICVSSQDWPFFKDSGGALPRRIVPLVRRKPAGLVPDRSLESKLRQELPGILQWAIEGLQRLTTRGGFDDKLLDKSSLDLITKALDNYVPFIDTMLVLEDGAEVTRADFMAAWRIFAKEKNVFSHTEMATIHYCKSAALSHYNRDIDDTSSKRLRGVRLKTEREMREMT